MNREHRYAVVGLGAIGSAAAYWLARRAGSDVVAFERYELGHQRGASEDHSRIIRRSYHTPWYVSLTAHAYRAWAEVELDAGKKLIVRTGGKHKARPCQTRDPQPRLRPDRPWRRLACREP